MQADVRREVAKDKRAFKADWREKVQKRAELRAESKPMPESINKIASLKAAQITERWEQELQTRFEEVRAAYNKANGSNPTSPTTNNRSTATGTTTTSGADEDDDTYVRHNTVGSIFTAMKYEIMRACGKFDIKSRPMGKITNTSDDARANDILAREKWQKVLRWMVANSEFIPEAIKLYLAEGSSILNEKEDFNSPTIRREDEIWTQTRRFFWHALDCLCHELTSSCGESVKNGRTAKTQHMEANPDLWEWVTETTGIIAAQKAAVVKKGVTVSTRKTLGDLVKEGFSCPDDEEEYPHWYHDHPDWTWEIWKAYERLRREAEEEADENDVDDLSSDEETEDEDDIMAE